jgi:hypothetical protein
MEATEGRTGGNESRTDAEPTTAGSVMVLEDPSASKRKRHATTGESIGMEATMGISIPKS